MYYKRLSFITGTSLLIISNNSSSNPDFIDNSFSGYNNSSPNVILIFLDDVGFTRLGPYSGNNLTPNIDALAADGVIYDSVYVSSAVCTPSRYSLLTGKFAGRCTHDWFLKENPVSQPYKINWNTYLDNNDFTIFEALGKRGYHTGYIGKWHLSHHNDLNKLFPEIDPEMPVEKADSLLALHQQLLADHIKKLTGADVVENVICENSEANPIKYIQCHHPEWMTLGLCDFIDNTPSDKPFFAFYASTLTHGPSAIKSLGKDPIYTPEGKNEQVMKYSLARQSVLDRFKNKVNDKDERKLGIIWLDDQIGTIVKKLKERGIYENTIIVILSDNNNEPGKAGCYEAGTHVPMIIKWRNEENKGTHSGQAIQSIDIFPTILEECDIEFKEKKFDGISFAKNKMPDRDDMYFEMGITRALKWGNYKYIAFKMPEDAIKQMKSGELTEAPNQMNIYWAAQTYVAMKAYPAYWDQDQLYDISKDPYELNNLAGDTTYTKILEEMKVRLQKYLNTFSHPYTLDFQEFMISEQFMLLRRETEKRMPEMINNLFMHNFKWPPEKK